MAKNGKRTGRPAGMGDRNKQRLLAAAREEFSSRGFRSVTLRSIAAQAGVDVALIARHFGSKDGLFAATVELPESAAEIVTTALSSPLHSQGERLTRAYLGLWEDTATSAQMHALARASVNYEGTGARLGEALMGAGASPRNRFAHFRSSNGIQFRRDSTARRGYCSIPHSDSMYCRARF